MRTWSIILWFYVSNDFLHKRSKKEITNCKYISSSKKRKIQFYWIEGPWDYLVIRKMCAKSYMIGFVPHAEV